MAELVGVVSGAAGLLSLAIQLASGAEKVKEAYRFSKRLPDEIKSLTEDLDFLRLFIEQPSRAHWLESSDAPEATYCRNRLQAVAEALDRLARSTPRDSNTSRIKSLGRMRQWKDELESVRTKIYHAKLSLVMLASLPWHDDPSLVHLVPIQGTPSPGDGPTHDHGQDSVLEAQVVSLEHQGSNTPGPARAYQQRRRPVKCTKRGCPCRCHTKGALIRRFWSFEYTPLSMILQSCDHPSCNGRRYDASIRVALSQLGLPWAFTLGFHFQSERADYSLYPSLGGQTIVRYTSPGFKLLFDIVHDEVELVEGLKQFTELWRRDPGMGNHVNPGGRTYVEELLYYPVRGWQFESVIALLDLFIKQFKMTRDLSEISLLYSCAHGIGEGPHMAIFQELIDLGFDSSDIASPELKKWPTPCDPNWISEACTPDPFFTEMLSILVASDSEFGGTSPLGCDVLLSPEKARQRLRKSADLVSQRNFLGQTPLHLAAAEQESLVLPLLEARHDVNATDLYGITPLMYTAGLGRTEAAKQLICYGAKMFLVDDLCHRTFLGFALARRQYRYALDIAHHIQATLPESEKAVGSYFAGSILMALVRDDSSRLFACSPSFIEELMNLVDDANFRFDDPRNGTADNHLLHYCWTLEQTKVLINHGFTGINRKRSDGATSLMMAASIGRLDLVRYYLEIGADIDAQDNCGRNALCHALEGWIGLNKVFSDEDDMCHLGTISFLITSDADIISRDTCGCPCSPEGCSPASLLPSHFAEDNQWWGLKNPFHTIEWLAILEGLGRDDLARATLLHLLRRAEFYRLEMGHTCCRSVSTSWTWSATSPTHGLSDEERKTISDSKQERNLALESTSSKHVSLSLDKLRHQWQQQLFELYTLHLDRNGLQSWSSILRQEHEPKLLCEPPKKVGRWKCNFRDDIMETSMTFTIGSPQRHQLHPYRELVRYTSSLEKEFAIRQSREEVDALLKWYNCRLIWILEVTEIMQIPLEYHVKGMRTVFVEDRDVGRRAEEFIQHFKTSREVLLETRK
ncbi:26S proteasome non-ATPase regulatory subunit 10 [Apiospora arundinis]|uniref:26S proteasome non-ATPase regulatory subunit 10 n=1 Tax=Apiospora arundinis TaxID=335852 RepID=A0ABR2JD45_9PEZI